MAKAGLLDLIEQIKNRPPGGKSIEGTHYSNNPDPMRRADGGAQGKAAAGAERARLTGDNRNRTYFYPNDVRQQQGYATPRPEPTVKSGPTYGAKLHDMYDLKTDPLGIARQSKSRNEFEAALKEMGYRGYENPDLDMMVNLTDDTEMLKMGDYRSQAEDNLERAARLPDSPYLVTAENKPSTDTEFGQWLGGKPELQERYQDQIEGLLDKRNFMRDLGVKDYSTTPGYGGYDGGVSPNSVIRVPDEETAQLVADARGVATQQDAVPYYQKKGGDTAGMSATMDRTVTPGILNAIHEATGLDMTRSSGDTMDFLNFKGEDGVPFSGRGDEAFNQELSSVFESLGSGIESVSPFQAQSNYNFTGGASASGPAAARLQGAGPASGEMRARIIAENEAFRKQHGFSDPKLLALLGGGAAAGLASQDSEASHAGLLEDAARLARSKEWGSTGDDYFHGTNADIDQFDPNKGDLGTHIGTSQQANNRLTDTALDRQEPGSGYGSNVMPVKTRANNPITMPDVGQWQNADSVREMMEQDEMIRSWPGAEAIFDKVYEARRKFEDNPVGQQKWNASPENRESLDELRLMIQDNGFDSIKYDNSVESRGGVVDPDVQKRVGELQLEADSHPRYSDARMDLLEQIEILDNPHKRAGRDSLIVLNEEDLRSSAADFQPEGSQDTKKAQLLRSAAPVAAGGLLAAGAMTPEEAQAQGMRDAGQQVVSSAEGMGREVWGALKGLWSGDEKQRTDVTSQRSVEAPQGLDELKGLLAQNLGEPLLEGLQGAQEAAYDPITSLLEYDSPLGGKTGDQITGLVDKVSEVWGDLDPETQERVISSGILGLAATDLIPGGKGVKQALPDFIDPRYSGSVPEQRLLAQGKAPTGEIIHNPDLLQLPDLKIEDLVDRPFVTSLYDRSRGEGILSAINGQELDRAVDMQGGNDFGLWHEGLVGASHKTPVNTVMNRAREMREETGMDPYFLNFNMAPTGVDFSTMPGETVLSMANQNLSKKQASMIDKRMRDHIARIAGKDVQVGISDWPGIKSEKAFESWEKAPGESRKQLLKMMNEYKDDIGVSQADSRILSTDPRRINASELSVQPNVGIIDTAMADTPMTKHRSYPYGIPGEMKGKLPEGLFDLYDLFPMLHDKAKPQRAAMSNMKGTFTQGLLDVLMAK